MLPFTLTINQNKQEIEMPTTWEEISEFQAIALSKADLDKKSEVLAILTGIPQKYLNELPSEKFDTLYQSSAPLFTAEKPDFQNLKRPKTIEIRGKKYSTDINPKTILHGYLESIRVKLKQIESEAKEGEEPRFLDHCSYYIGFSLAGKIITKKDKESDKMVGCFDEDRALALVEEIKRMPFMIIHPVGSFFLRRLLVYYGLQQSSYELKILVMKSKQVLKSSRSLGPFSRLRVLLGMTGRKRNSTSIQKQA
jgi:hypothetical protein